MDFFLGGEFTSYGLDVINMTELEPDQREDPMSRVFPKVTKCTFHKYGHSGTIEKHDALCLLALNIISEKIYVFLWFWLIILAVLTAAYMVYTVAVIAVPALRKTMLQVKKTFLRFFLKLKFLMGSNKYHFLDSSTKTKGTLVQERR